MLYHIILYSAYLIYYIMYILYILHFMFTLIIKAYSLIHIYIT